MLAVGWAIALPASQADALPAAMSSDLCADLLLLRLAEPGQIRSVSYQAQDPRLSPLAEQARLYPANRGSVEELLTLRPEVAFVHQGWRGRHWVETLQGQGIEVVALPYPQSWDQALATARLMAERLGRVAAVKPSLSALAQRMDDLGRCARRAPSHRLLYLRPSGGTAGEGTYIDDLIRRLGQRNLAAEQGIKGWGQIRLERLLSDPPDLFLLGYFDQAGVGARAAYGRHPALRALIDRIPAVWIQGQAWGCGGLELITVAEQIAASLDSECRRSAGEE
ncbi:ABC transporter substrate-binding protein [Caldichromatium japonicum]|uniref:ABC transporter substrate-binding protein n=2 Tax=Caldichromatium japonicum TaxID=2699430 RepID=A0A6G7VGU7_9GAMM|nr:ABC transporter substrate-binding protein [Caldichromatium japonicum]